MTDSRYLHTASVLPNGKVLVAGGSLSASWRSTELYDPATGTWTPTGNMTAIRSEHTASVLPNGKVLVAGGLSLGGGRTAELYDPGSVAS